ncbi:MAG: CDP-glycerol glycerophosphotransferase family protein [bacterium]
MERILHAVIGDRSYDLVYWWLFFRTTPVPRNKKKTLIILNHVFEQDLEALELANHTFNFVILSAFLLRHVGTSMFPPSVENFRIYNSPELEPIRKRYRKVVDRFVRRLKDTYHPVAMIAPSDNFFYVRELVAALRDQGIPYFVVDKEGTICPAYFIHFADYIKENCPLIAEHILVWSERQRQFWEKTGVASSKITVVGQPRSDFWRQPQRWLAKNDLGIPGLRPDAKVILFFTYDPWAYTPDYMIEKGEMHWDVLRDQTHHALFTLAQEHPELDFIIKAHPQQLDRVEIQQEIDRYGVKNVFLVTGSTLSNHLIVNADCIIGFQTTALIESMLTDKPIIYTFWGEAKTKWSNDLIPFDTTKGVLVAESPEALRQSVIDAIAYPELTPEQRSAREHFVQEYLQMVDGHSSERTLRELDRLTQHE